MYNRISRGTQRAHVGLVAVSSTTYTPQRDWLSLRARTRVADGSRPVVGEMRAQAGP